MNRASTKPSAVQCVKSQLCRQIVGVAVLTIAMIAAPVLLPAIGAGMGLGAGLGVATCGGDTNCIVNSTIVGGLTGTIPVGAATTVLGRIALGGVAGSLAAGSNEFLTTGTVTPRTVAVGFVTGAAMVGVIEGASPFLARRAATSIAAETTSTSSRVAATNSADDALRSVDDVMGGLSPGRQPHVRTVSSPDELQTVYDDLATGGVPTEWPGYKGTVVRRADGVEVGLRPGSSSGSATIDIRVPGQSRPIKVHIG